MKTLVKLSILLFVAIITLSSCDVQDINPDSSTGDSDFPGNSSPKTETLFTSVPTPINSSYHNEDNCAEGGRHRYYTSNERPGTIADKYESDLKAAGWSIVYSNQGGSWNGFGGGATIKATKGSRYLKFNVGGNGTMHVDITVWPQRPNNENCNNNNNNNDNDRDKDRDNDNGNDNDDKGDDNTPKNLFESVNDPAGAKYISSDNCRENGKHKYYTSNDRPTAIVNAFASDLKRNGWEIKYQDSDEGWNGYGGGGDVKATKGGRYLKFHVGGNGTMHIDLCVWPTRPNNDNCNHQDNN